MADTSDFKNGLCLSMEGALFQIIEFQHVKPGKGGAFVRTKLKNLNTSRVIEKTFNAGVKVETARIEIIPYQYLYKDSTGYVFMNMSNYEQLTLPEESVSNADLMKEAQDVQITFHAETGRCLGCELPAFVELKATYTEPGMQGGTVNKVTKKAILETGAEINVPLFIESGEILKIDTRTREYSERAKNKQFVIYIV